MAICGRTVVILGWTIELHVMLSSKRGPIVVYFKSPSGPRALSIKDLGVFNPFVFASQSQSPSHNYYNYHTTTTRIADMGWFSDDSDQAQAYNQV